MSDDILSRLPHVKGRVPDALLHKPGYPSPDRAPVRVCVLDLGTNSFHAVIVDAKANGTFVLLDKIKELVSLGEYESTGQRLSAEAMERGMDALKRILILAGGWRVEEHLAFATSAIREAPNGGDFIDRVQAELGLRVRAIAGDMEAGLIWEGVRQAVEMPELTLVLDIGGGSAEFVIGTSSQRAFAASLKLGAARMTGAFAKSDPVSDKDWKAMRKHFRKTCSHVFSVARAHEVRDLVGSSGAIENLAQAFVNVEGDATRTIYQHELDAKAMRRMAKSIARMSRSERAEVDGIDEKRLDQIVAGACLFDVVVKDLGIERVRVSPYALREGMVVYFIQQNYRRIEQLAPFVDVRRRSVYELGMRCGWEEHHADQVAKLALKLFDVCRPLHKMGEDDRELLEYASLLHDIGYHISRRNHHRHSAYILRHTDLQGFQPDEIEIMSYVVRYHAGSLPRSRHRTFRSLAKKRRKRILKLASFLRLAEGLDRSHFQNVQQLEAELGSKSLRLKLKTLSEPQLDLWGAERGADLFQKVFDRQVKVSIDDE